MINRIHKTHISQLPSQNSSSKLTPLRIQRNVNTGQHQHTLRAKQEILWYCLHWEVSFTLQFLLKYKTILTQECSPSSKVYSQTSGSNIHVLSFWLTFWINSLVPRHTHTHTHTHTHRGFSTHTHTHTHTGFSTHTHTHTQVSLLF